MLCLHDLAVTALANDLADLVVVGQVGDAAEGLDLISLKMKFTLRFNIIEDIDLLLGFLLPIHKFLHLFLVAFNFGGDTGTAW